MKRITKLFVVFVFSLMVGTQGKVDAGEKNINVLLKDHRDQRIIGEPKTRVAAPTSGVLVYKSGKFYHAGESLVTPLVVGDEAFFGGSVIESLGYTFKFACLGWKYDIKAYVTSTGEAVRVSSPVELDSPDKKTRVSVRLVDVGLAPAFVHPLTEAQVEQQRTAQVELDLDYQRTEAGGTHLASRYTMPYPDPLNHEERITASKELIVRLLEKGIDGCHVVDGAQIKFNTEQVSN
jgi:hypothetical protein